MRPTQLVLVRRSEEQQYLWNLVEDSEPLVGTALEEYANIGLAGFDFPESFKPPSAKGEESYD